MKIEEIPIEIGIKRSIAILGTLMFIGGVCFGYFIGFEDSTSQASNTLHVDSQNNHIIHAGEHYYKVQEVNTSEIELRRSLIHDPVNRTP
jgi:hypothetical protein